MGTLGQSVSVVVTKGKDLVSHDLKITGDVTFDINDQISRSEARNEILSRKLSISDLDNSHNTNKNIKKFQENCVNEILVLENRNRLVNAGNDLLGAVQTVKDIYHGATFIGVIKKQVGKIIYGRPNKLKGEGLNTYEDSSVFVTKLEESVNSVEGLKLMAIEKAKRIKDSNTQLNKIRKAKHRDYKKSIAENKGNMSDEEETSAYEMSEIVQQSEFEDQQDGQSVKDIETKIINRTRYQSQPNNGIWSTSKDMEFKSSNQKEKLTLIEQQKMDFCKNLEFIGASGLENVEMNKDYMGHMKNSARIIDKMENDASVVGKSKFKNSSIYHAYAELLSNLSPQDCQEFLGGDYRINGNLTFIQDGGVQNNNAGNASTTISRTTNVVDSTMLTNKSGIQKIGDNNDNLSTKTSNWSDSSRGDETNTSSVKNRANFKSNVENDGSNYKNAQDFSNNDEQNVVKDNDVKVRNSAKTETNNSIERGEPGLKVKIIGTVIATVVTVAGVWRIGKLSRIGKESMERAKQYASIFNRARRAIKDLVNKL